MRFSFSLLSFLMSASLIFSSTALGSSTAPRQNGQSTATPLSNKDVVEMVKMNLSTEVIVAKIKASVSNFDTTPAALQELKDANVSDAVILAMVQVPTGDALNKSSESGNEKANSTFTAGETKALVYVYRKKNFNTRNMQPSVYVDGVELARMDDGKFFIVKLDPGKHSVEVNKGHSGAEIEMKAGEHYYFRIDIKPGFWKGRSEITYMQKEQGSLEMQKMTPLEAKWIKDKSKVTVEDQSVRSR